MEAADLHSLFVQWATDEGLPLDRSQIDGRTYVWMQTEQAWFGFRGLAAMLERKRRSRLSSRQK